MRGRGIRLRRDEVIKRLGLGLDIETTALSVEISRDDIEVIQRGLYSLQKEIHDWLKPKKTLRIFRSTPNPYAPQGMARLDQIEALMFKLESLKSG